MNTVLSTLDNTLVRDGLLILAGYTLARVGLPTLYQDVKHFIQGVISSVKTATASKTTAAGQ